MPKHTPDIPSRTPVFDTDLIRKVDAIDGELNTHEAVCAERYEQINARLRRLERIVMGTAGTIILLLCSIVMRDVIWP